MCIFTLTCSFFIGMRKTIVYKNMTYHLFHRPQQHNGLTTRDQWSAEIFCGDSSDTWRSAVGTDRSGATVAAGDSRCRQVAPVSSWWALADPGEGAIRPWPLPKPQKGGGQHVFWPPPQNSWKWYAHQPRLVRTHLLYVCNGNLPTYFHQINVIHKLFVR